MIENHYEIWIKDFNPNSNMPQGIANPRSKLAQSYFQFRENQIGAIGFEPAT
tara:strand:+ start:1093 stop:1248 length:156 start_codon:yes stop_codon:yes gene_type:complete